MQQRLVSKIGATLVLAGAAITTALGAWGSWSTSDSDQQSTEIGVLDLDLSQLGSSAFTVPVGTEADPLVAGDSGCRTINVVNDGTVDFANFRFWIDSSALIDDGAITATNAGADVVDNDGDGRSLAEEALTLTLYRKNAAFVGGTCAALILEADGEAMSMHSIATMNADDEAVAIDATGAGAGLFAAPDTRGGASTAHLAVLYSLNPAADADIQGVRGDLTFTFAADQRAASTDR